MIEAKDVVGGSFLFNPKNIDFIVRNPVATEWNLVASSGVNVAITDQEKERIFKLLPKTFSEEIVEKNGGHFYINTDNVTFAVFSLKTALWGLLFISDNDLYFSNKEFKKFQKKFKKGLKSV